MASKGTQEARPRDRNAVAVREPTPEAAEI